jgi:hypothetical protein
VRTQQQQSTQHHTQQRMGVPQQTYCTHAAKVNHQQVLFLHLLLLMHLLLHVPLCLLLLLQLLLWVPPAMQKLL